MTEPAAGAPVSLWHHGDFLRLWFGQAVSEVGSQVSVVAIPLTAVVTLGATPLQAGILGALAFLPFLLVGLPAGVWVDRLARRPLLVAADAGRLLVIGSLPVAAVFHVLGFAQLYGVALLSGVLTVVFDVAYQSYLPALVASSQLVEANSRLELTRASAEIAGPGLGGLLVAALTAPIAIAADAASYAVSVASLLLVHTHEPPVDRGGGHSVRAELAEGFAYVVRHPVLRRVAACTGTANLFSHMGSAVMFVFAVRELGLGPGGIGLWLSLGSLGAPVGALVAGRLGRRVRVGTIIVCSAAVSGSWLLVPLATRAVALPWLVAAGVIGSAGSVVYNITQVSLRQSITPSRLQGRMNATMRFLVWGTIPVGALAGGVLGTLIGVRPTLWVVGVGSLLTVVPVVSGPVRRLGLMGDAVVSAAGQAAGGAHSDPAGDG